MVVVDVVDVLEVVLVVVQGVVQLSFVVQDVPQAYIVTNEEPVVGISSKQ